MAEIIASNVVPGTDWTITITKRPSGFYHIDQSGTDLTYGGTGAKSESEARRRANDMWKTLIEFRDRPRF